MRKIDEIIVHCSATKAGKHFDENDIRRWHLARGFADIGYHYVVLLDGTVRPGRPLANIGAHCLNHNARSIGVCYIGGLDANGKPTDTRTPAQKKALLSLLKELKARFPEIKNITGHNAYAAKACPCFDAAKEYRNI